MQINKQALAKWDVPTMYWTDAFSAHVANTQRMHKQLNERFTESRSRLSTAAKGQVASGAKQGSVRLATFDCSAQ